MRRLGLHHALVAAATAALLVPVTVGTSGASGAVPRHTIHPGVTVSFGGVSCRVGAVVHQQRKVYLVIPASCGGVETGKEQDGCSEPQSPVGVPVRIQGAKHRGTLAYTSFSAMQLRGEKNPNRCYDNDFALVKVNPRDRSRVTGAIPGTQAPSGVGRKVAKQGAAILIGSAAAKAGVTDQGGWRTAATTTASIAATDVGVPVILRNQIIGMLTVIPSGLLVKSDPMFYNFRKALRELHHAKGFRHVHLLRAGQHL